MSKKNMFLLILMGLYINLYSQLSGTYTVGKPGDDYLNFSSAMIDLQNFGTSGNVEFLFSSGVYNSLIFNASFITDSVILRSAAADRDSVVFDFGDFNTGNYVLMENMSFIKQNSGSQSSVLQIYPYGNFVMRNCAVIDTLSLSYSSNNATFLCYNSIVENCFIKGINANVPNIPNIYSVRSDNNSKFYNDSIIGNWNLVGGCAEIENCYLEMNRLNAPNCAITNNTIAILDHSFSTNSILKIGKLDSCLLIGEAEFVWQINNRFTSNIIKSPIRFKDMTGGKIENNDFKNNVTFWNVSNTILNRNVFRDFIQPSHSVSNLKFINNFLLDTISIYNAGFYNNNMGPSSHIILSSNPDLRYNNIHTVSYQNPYAYPKLYGNNFFGKNAFTLASSFFDPSAYHSNPNYIDSADLHITNFGISSNSGKIYNSYSTYDFDGDYRSLHASFGADEICMDFTLADTLYFSCGRRFKLKTCNIPSSIGLSWGPDSLIDVSTYSIPSILVDTIHKIWLLDSMGYKVDSMILIPENVPNFGKVIIDAKCGSLTKLKTFALTGSTVLWSPDSLLSNPFADSITIFPEKDISYTAIVDNGKCGVRNDTFDINVVYPTAYFDVDSQNCTYVSMSAKFDCFDSLKWSFGDGNFANNKHISHQYTSTGFYLVILQVWFKGQYHSFDKVLEISCVATEEFEEYNFLLYPNPVSEKLFLSNSNLFDSKVYKLQDQEGRLIHKGKFHSNVDVKNLNSGIYYLSIDDKKWKFIKQ